MRHQGYVRTLPGPELLEPVLDLSRPELALVMKRYAPSVSAQVVSGPVALVVERPGFSDPTLKDSLRGRGWAVRVCAGPSGTNCPLLTGNECHLRSEADVAIVFVNQRGPGVRTRIIPRIRCASHPSSPGVVAMEGSLQGPAFSDHTATVGGLRGPETIIETAERLIHAEGK